MLIGFEIDNEKLQRLDALRLRIGDETGVDLFNNAMTLLEWAAARIAEGKVIAALDHEEHTMDVMDMDFVEKIARNPL